MSKHGKLQEGGERKSMNRLKGDPMRCKNRRDNLMLDGGPLSDWSDCKSCAKII